MQDITPSKVSSSTAQALKAFSRTRSVAMALVSEVASLELPDPSDRKQANLIAQGRKKVKRIRNSIESLRKDLNAPLLHQTKDTNAVAKELTKLVAPQEARLSLLENNRKEWLAAEKEREAKELQALIDLRVATMQHLGARLAPSVAGSLDEATWLYLLGDATKDYEKAEAKRKAKEAAQEEKLKAALEDKEKHAKLSARVSIASRHGVHMTAEEALGFSNAKWDEYMHKLAKDGQVTGASLERAKDAEVAEGVEGNAPLVVDIDPGPGSERNGLNRVATDLFEALEGFHFRSMSYEHKGLDVLIITLLASVNEYRRWLDES